MAAAFEPEKNSACNRGYTGWLAHRSFCELPSQIGALLARIDGRIDDKAPRRKRGGQPGNANAWRHGNRSAAASISRKFSTARIRALAHLAHRHGLLPANDQFRFRTRPARLDQIDLLWRFDPELAAILTQGGWAG
jgi:hypothetical protein